MNLIYFMYVQPSITVNVNERSNGEHVTLKH